MQLTRGGVATALGVLAAGLLGAAPAQADDAVTTQGEVSSGTGVSANAYDQTASEVGTWIADTALLIYQEDQDRVRAIETEAGLTWNSANGIIVSGKFTYDSLTGATPNGSVRSRYEQTFVPPRKTRFIGGGEVPLPDTSTGSSGRYTVAPNQLPVDKGFKDHRQAYDLGVTLPVAETLKVSLGGSASTETDFTSYSARASLAKDLNNKNTTLSLGFNYERDSVRPFTGVPRALSYMGDRIVGSARVKQVYSVVAGVTQVLTPKWLVQLNYNYGNSRGYNTDPYKIFALVDVETGDPFYYIYEKRPDRRERSSIYAATKFALGSAVTDASVRWYHDSWGINSMTYALSEHMPLGRAGYVEPGLRFYRQTAASFFHHYLGIDQPTPKNVSSDSRLSRFHAWTFGLKAGAHLTSRLELYGAAERYVQEGLRFDRKAPGVLARTDLFSGTRSVSLITGVRYTFQ